MKTLKLITLCATLAATAAMGSACGAVSNGESNDGTPTPEPTNQGDLEIADIQKGNVDVNALVTLEGVVVTAVSIGDQGVDFWAQDAGGGAQSGIYFFDRDGLTPADIAVGDVVTVSGEYTEFYDLSEITVSEIEVTGTGAVTADLVALAELQAGSNAEVWEGCLVEIDGESLEVAASANQYGEFPVTDGSASVNVDDELYDATEGLGAGAPVNYIAGVWHYAFEEYKLLLRGADDIETEVAPVTSTTITDIQTGAVEEEGNVTIENVIVTAVRSNAFWVQDAGGGPNSGIYVVALGGTELPEGLAVGDKVNVTGAYKEFYELSEIALQAATIVDSGNTVTVNDVDIADLQSGTTAEQWESCLINLTGGPFTVSAAANEFKEFPVTAGSNTLKVDDYLYDASANGVANSDTLTTLRGVLNYHFDEWKILPRDAADIVE